MIILTLSFVYLRCAVSLAYYSLVTCDQLFGKDLFEGDLKLPMEVILTHYNASSIPNGRTLLQKERMKRIHNKSNESNELHHAAVSSRIYLWPNGIVYYKISSTFTDYESLTIVKAIQHWEETTCIRFIQAGSRSNYLYINNNGRSCYSDSVGYFGNIQIINLGLGCLEFSLIVHEIGHAIGFWHEQSRPDRNKYITLNFNNIQESLQFNFMKLNDIYTDYYGVEYDYGSIMHYSPHDFVRYDCTGSDCVTFTVANVAEYGRQGSPRIGFASELSWRDVTQANRMYSCGGSGVTGILLIKMKYGTTVNLTLFNPHIFVRVESADSKGKQFFRHTEPIQYAHHVVWKEFIWFGYSTWQFFRISIVDVENYRLTQSKTIPIQREYNLDWNNCDIQKCKNFVLFEFLLDASPILFARLKVYTRSARHLVNKNSKEEPDPYVRVDAFQSSGVIKIAYSEIKINTTNPNWNSLLDFGCQAWKLFYIQVFDEELGRDGRLSDRQTVILKLGTHSNMNHICYGSGQLIFDYIFTDAINSCTF